MFLVLAVRSLVRLVPTRLDRTKGPLERHVRTDTNQDEGM